MLIKEVTMLLENTNTIKILCSRDNLTPRNKRMGRATRAMSERKSATSCGIPIDRLQFRFRVCEWDHVLSRAQSIDF